LLAVVLSREQILNTLSILLWQNMIFRILCKFQFQAHHLECLVDLNDIFIPIPMVDRGKGDPRNLLAVVLSREEHGYKLGTKSGVLRGLYTRKMGIRIFFQTSTSVKILSDRFLILLACLLIDSEAFRLSSEITSSLEHLQLFFQAFNRMTTNFRQFIKCLKMPVILQNA
jgi:hypothetical protein